MNYLYYILYKTVNNVNGKYYFGIHRTNDLNDGYLGSGKNLLQAIKKYGKDSFTREILKFCKDSDDLNEMEKSLITINVVNDRNCYNIKIGGFGDNAPAPTKPKHIFKIIYINGLEEIIDDLDKFCKLHNLSKNSIRKVRNGQNSYYKNIKRVINMNNLNEDLSKYFMNQFKRFAKIHSQKYNHKYVDGYYGSRDCRKRKYKLTTMDNREIIVKGLNDFCRKNDYDFSTLMKIKSGKVKKHLDIIGVQLIDN